MHCNPDFPADIVPVDVCMNAIITAAWERGIDNDCTNVEFRNIVSFCAIQKLFIRQNAITIYF